MEININFGQSDTVVHQEPFSKNLKDQLRSKGVTPSRFWQELVDMACDLPTEELNSYLKVTDDDILEIDTDKIVKRILINKKESRTKEL